MSDPRCDCCDLPVYSCGRAVEMRQRQQQHAERAALLRSGWFPAIYAGTCSGCGERIEVDTLIRHVGEGWIGECCADVG